MPLQNNRTSIRLIVLAAILIIAAGGWAVRTAWTHYRAVLHDFEPWPPGDVLAHPERTGIAGLTAVTFRSSRGNRIAGWYVPARNRAAVIVTHGTNADRTSMLDEIRMLSAAGFGVLAFDWPGNGQSEGAIEWGANERAAFIAAIDWLVQRPEVDRDRIGAFGFSMGGYFTTLVAADDRRLRAVAIASAPTSFLDYTRQAHERAGWLGRVSAELALRRVGMLDETVTPSSRIGVIAPRTVLLIGGSEDRSIPNGMTARLFALAGEPKQLWIVPGAGHGHYLAAQPSEYPRRIVRFFDSALLSP